MSFANDGKNDPDGKGTWYHQREEHASRFENTTMYTHIFVGLILGMFASLLTTESSHAQPTAAKSSTPVETRRFGDDWPMFLGPTADGKSSETGIVKDWSGDNPQVLWQLPLSQSYGTCTVSRGRLFQFDSESVGSPRLGKSVGKVLCLNSESGERLWSYTYEYDYADQYGYNNGPRCSPIVDGDRVYAYGVDGRLTCLSFEDGAEIWKVEASKDHGVIQNFFGVGSNPVVFGDLLVVLVGGSPKPPTRIDLARGDGSGIVAFNKFNGKVVYRLSDELASYASLKLVNTTRPWVFAFTRGGLLGFDPRTGMQDFFFPWRAQILESVNASVPVVWGEKVFISETYGPGSALLDFSKVKDGKPEVVWQDRPQSREKSLQTHWNTAIHHEGYLYASSGRHQYNAELRCIHANSGKVMWSQPGLSRCSLLYADQHLICLSETGVVSLLKATPDAYVEVAEKMFSEAGKPLLRPPAWAAPVLSHGLLYLRGAERLICAKLISAQK